VVDTRTEMRSDRINFYLSGTLTARHNGEIVAERQWDTAIERDFICDGVAAPPRSLGAQMISQAADLAVSVMRSAVLIALERSPIS
jgi:hypothetical protein